MMNNIKNKKGEFTLQGMIIASLTAFLFIGFIAFTISSLTGNYNTEGYNPQDLEKYDLTTNISTAVNDAYNEIDGVTVDKSVFDYLGDVWSKIVAPFKFVYRSFTTLISLTGSVVNDLQLPIIFKDYISAILTVLIIIGVVMIKFYLGRKK